MGDVVVVDFRKKEPPTLIINPAIVIEMFRENTIDYKEAHRLLFYPTTKKLIAFSFMQRRLRMTWTCCRRIWSGFQMTWRERSNLSLMKELIPAWAS